MGKLGRRDTEGVEQLDMLAGIAQVVLTANDMRDPHRDVVDHIDKMERRAAVGPENDKIAAFRTSDLAADRVVDFHGLRADFLDFLAGVVVKFGIALTFQAERLLREVALDVQRLAKDEPLIPFFGPRSTS